MPVGLVAIRHRWRPPCAPGSRSIARSPRATPRPCRRAPPRCWRRLISADLEWQRFLLSTAMLGALASGQTQYARDLWTLSCRPALPRPALSAARHHARQLGPLIQAELEDSVGEKPSERVEKGPAARRRPKSAREAYFLYASTRRGVKRPAGPSLPRKSSRRQAGARTRNISTLGGEQRGGNRVPRRRAVWFERGLLGQRAG